MRPFSSSYPEHSPKDVAVTIPFTADALTKATYDYIIVGGGTAGCCLAARLSEDPSVSVLLIERGGAVDTWTSKVPLLSANPNNGSRLFIEWPSKPMKHVDDRTVGIARGEGLGGTSRVNAMLYTRGAPSEYNNWQAMGHPNWCYDDLCPYFIKSERTLSQPRSRFRGHTGPWENQTFTDLSFPFLNYFRPAAERLGIPSIPDLNSPTAPAVACGTLDVAIDHKVYRASTFHAFLPHSVASARSRNLKICTRALATRLEIIRNSSAGMRAEGLYFEDYRGNAASANTYYVQARREVIVCCGALASPQLLMLSGLGPRAHLQEHGIALVRDMPGVGSNLKDHFDLPITFEAPLEDTIHLLLEKPWRGIVELLKYVVNGRGLLSTPFVQMAIFLRTPLLNDRMEVVTTDTKDLDPTLPENIPDIEIKPIALNAYNNTQKIGVVTLLTCLVTPKSLGSVRLASHNPRDHPIVDLDFLNDPRDYVPLRKGVKLSMRLGQEIGVQGYPLKPLGVPASQEDHDVDHFIRTGARTCYHYASTCRMGPETEDKLPGVGDDELRVHGIQNLRVCDASVFPEIIAAHTMAPVVAVAEKCADLIKQAYGKD
ncbi:alcohol oxidase [Heliocybe sulcata]|uniref:Alcohol oxidase n=1 Tax=Heliocybe sulcata TaxID=5364 RepID=A0A5C3ND83_9AGAM|nr:alcohol oxidase [Heliocybe sulcata]